MKTEEFIKVFPTTFFLVNDLLDESELNLLQNKADEIYSTIKSGGYNWASKDVYTTLDTLDLKSLKEFSNCIEKVKYSVNKMNNINGFNFEYSCATAWLNVYGRGDYQESHTHAGYTYSAVFFLKSNAECSPLIFENPISNIDMLPPKIQTVSNENNYGTYLFEPKQNSLIVFRSYLRHMVTKNNTDHKRVSIAFNF
jgi:uncharacterized protein (TIGR02466 family)